MRKGEVSEPTFRCVADVATPHAARYMAQLCKRFERRCEVVLKVASGRIIFPNGTCVLRAKAKVLALTLDAADEVELADLQDVVSEYLLRIAFRETLYITWRMGL